MIATHQPLPPFQVASVSPSDHDERHRRATSRSALDARRTSPAAFASSLLARAHMAMHAVHRAAAAIGLYSSPSLGEDGSADVLDCWRGMRDLRVTSTFLSEGGSEVAPMSTTSDVGIALKYALRDVGGSGDSERRSNASLLFRVRTRSFMQRGANLSFLSTFPTEAEYLYPPMTYVRPTGPTHEVAFDEVRFTVVDVEPIFPS